MNSTVHHQDEQITLHLGDCLDVLPTLPDASVDAVVCDPPYGLEFMGKDWDAPWKTGNGFRRAANEADVGRDNAFGRTSRTSPQYMAGRGFQEWCTAWARECLRVLKPGGHLLAFGAPRTYHRLAAGIEDAGFEIRDSIHWIFGSGFPKGQDVGKAIDRRRDDRDGVLRVTAWLRQARDAAGWTSARIDALFGFNGMASHWCAVTGKAAIVPTLEQWAALRDAIGFDDSEILPLVERLNARKGEIGEAFGQREIVSTAHRVRRSSDVQIAGLSDGAYDVTAPALDAAKRWEGWNTSLKPAHEPIIVARKSTGFNTTVANVLEHGTGALNIDACRVGLNGEKAPTGSGDRRGSSTYAQDAWTRTSMTNGGNETPDAGRWPANLVLTHAPGCREVGTRTVRNPSGSVTGEEPSALVDAVYAERKRVPYQARETETVPVWDCQPGCPVAELDRQSGASRSRIGKPRGAAAGDGWGMTRTGAEYDDAGGSSRFFPVFRYEAKAPASERPRLSDGTAHATVKPLEFMRWLVRLVTPPGGTVLDPFAGSGTTGEAAIVEGFNALLIERERPYADLIVARLSKPLQPTLFGEAA